MSDASIAAWESELKALLERIRTHPSADLTAERQRAVVLEKLIGDYNRTKG
jgi:hypothetical protein